MTRTIFGLVVKEGLYLSLVMTVVITATFLWNPYLWLGDYPPDIQAVVGEVEIPDVQITISGLVFITAGVVMLIRSYKRLAREYRGELGFVKAFTLLFLTIRSCSSGLAGILHNPAGFYHPARYGRNGRVP